MAKTRAQKEKIVEALAKKLANAKSIVFTNFKKVKVPDVEELKKELRQENIYHEAVKKTLLKLALEEAGYKDEIDFSESSGSLNVSLGEDEVMPAKILGKFKKDHEGVQFLAGIIDKELVNAEKVGELSKMPSKIEILAQTVAQLKAPISGFANVLSGNLRNLVYALNAIKESKN